MQPVLDVYLISIKTLFTRVGAEELKGLNLNLKPSKHLWNISKCRLCPRPSCLRAVSDHIDAFFLTE